MATFATSPGVQPLQAQAPLQSGRYYFAPNTTNVGTSATLSNGALRVVAWTIPNGVTLSRIGAEVTSAGDAGSKFRLGIYADDGTGRPGNLIIDAGTIAGDSVAVQEITISQAIGAGTVWIGGAVQLVTVTQPTMRTNAGGPVVPADELAVIPGAAAVTFGYTVGGITGALPATFGAVAVLGINPARVFVKVA